MRVMINMFNERLSQLALHYPQTVLYMDLRNTVKSHQWADEIHPNSQGFQAVSLKYQEIILAHLKAVEV